MPSLVILVVSLKSKVILLNVCLSNVLIQLLCFVLLCLPIIALYDINWNWCFIFLSFCSPSFWKWLHTCTKRCTSNKTPKIWDISQTMQKNRQGDALFHLSPTLNVSDMCILFLLYGFIALASLDKLFNLYWKRRLFNSSFLLLLTCL